VPESGLDARQESRGLTHMQYSDSRSPTIIQRIEGAISMLFSKKKDDSAEAAAKDAEAMSATDLLKKDHRTVSALFRKLEDTEEEAEKVALAQEICTELTIHAEIEERVFYPAARQQLEEESEELVDEAAVEHRSLKMLIAEIDGSHADDELFDANLKVLKEYVEHHVKEEENEMFPRLKASDFDNEGVGAKLAEAKEELKAKLGEPRAPRAGARPVVHVPDLSGKGKSKTAKASSSSKSTSSSKSSSSQGKAKNGRSTGSSARAHHA
jgi:hemerythrin superfamily protein